MLSRPKIAQALEHKREALREAARGDVASVDIYGRALEQLAGLSADSISDRLGGVEWPGARPTSDFEASGLLARCGLEWPSAAAARAWALEKLLDVCTLAVDGSQIAASKEFGVPVSLLQIAWFENSHSAEGAYVKDVRNDVLTSDDVEDGEAVAFSDSMVNRTRFALEMEVASERLEALAGKDPLPVVFVDGSFVLSFAGRMLPDSRDAYLQALFRLLDASERFRVPVVGYIDRSYARDLTAMLRNVFDLPGRPVFDAQILQTSMNLFDRTAVFETARGDVLPYYRSGDRDYSAQLCFVYLKTGHDRLPARLDFPRWILDAGLLDYVVDVVRAEASIGPGYPYCLEAADAAAVLTTEDRLAFYRLWSAFAEDAGLEWSLPGKTASKSYRR